MSATLLRPRTSRVGAPHRTRKLPRQGERLVSKFSPGATVKFSVRRSVTSFQLRRFNKTAYSPLRIYLSSLISSCQWYFLLSLTSLLQKSDK
jgi:hypothetical protein